MLPARTDTVVIGAGQHGLGVSYELRLRGIQHVVLERGQIGDSWRTQRWDSFRLNTPAWMNRLPGAPEPADRDAFATAEEFAASLERHAFRHRLPVRTGVTVTSVEHDPRRDRFHVRTDEGAVECRTVVLAGGAARVPRLPALHARLPERLQQLHSSGYRNPAALAPGAVLVVGGGQSGLQIAEDLLAGGRRVYLASSRVGRLPRRYRGRDSLEWLAADGFYDERLEDAQAPGVRPPRQPQISGAAGGRTVSYQALERQGAVLMGRLAAVEGSRVVLGDELSTNVAFADSSSAAYRARIEAHIRHTGTDAPLPDEDPADEPYPGDLPRGPRELDLDAAGVGAVVWATGLGCDTSWLHVDGVLDDRDEIVHRQGATDVPGLFVAGQPWLRSRRSAMIYGVVADAPHLAAQVADRSAAPVRVAA